MINRLKNFDIRRRAVEKAKAEPLPPPSPTQPKKLKLRKFSSVSFSMPKVNFASLSSPRRFSIKKQTFFAKRLSFLIRAGVPMLESIHVIKTQSKTKNEIRIFEKIGLDVANGQTLATSLARFKGVFSSFAVNIIKAGESSGTLVDNLSYLADELKKKDLLRKKILGAMLYPLIILLATFGITTVLIVYIFPKIMPIFQSLNAKLPITTRMVLWLSETIRDYGLYMFLGFILLIVVFIVLKKRVARVRLFVDGLIVNIPLVGPIAKYYNLTNVSRTLGLLLKSGNSLTDALIITAETTENTAYKKSLGEISRNVMRGKNVGEFLSHYPKLYPEMIPHMISVGERTGNLSNTLIYLSEYYENEFEDLTKNLSTTIEPVLMIVMGIMVGFIAISVITPIYDITKSIHK